MFHVEQFGEGVKQRTSNVTMGGDYKKSEESVQYSETFQADRKVITVESRKNVRGAFVRVVEDVRGRKDCVCIPIEGLPALIRSLQAAQMRS